MVGKRYSILYEDDTVIVVDKPSGVLVIPAPSGEKNTLTDMLNKDLDARGIQANAYPCHRLDRETSGIMVYAKGKSVQKLIMDQFRKREVKKRYIAFVQGHVKGDGGTITRPIFDRNKKKSEPAVTRYRVIARKKDLSIIEAEPITGRTNQIRIHLKSIGHPIVGESVYAFRKDYGLRFKRVALHAQRIEFKHPVTRQRMAFESPLPGDMSDLLSKIN
jgi:23S rRNA pseudouridine1911/1915/1917 synthase